jgi:hypothetical protein
MPSSFAHILQFDDWSDQLPITELEEELGKVQLNTSSKHFSQMGHPSGHSSTPHIICPLSIRCSALGH